MRPCLILLLILFFGSILAPEPVKVDGLLGEGLGTEEPELNLEGEKTMQKEKGFEKKGGSTANGAKASLTLEDVLAALKDTPSIANTLKNFLRENNYAALLNDTEPGSTNQAPNHSGHCEGCDGNLSPAQMDKLEGFIVSHLPELNSAHIDDDQSGDSIDEVPSLAENCPIIPEFNEEAIIPVHGAKPPAPLEAIEEEPGLEGVHTPAEEPGLEVYAPEEEESTPNELETEEFSILQSKVVTDVPVVAEIYTGTDSNVEPAAESTTPAHVSIESTAESTTPTHVAIGPAAISSTMISELTILGSSSMDGSSASAVADSSASSTSAVSSSSSGPSATATEPLPTLFTPNVTATVAKSAPSANEGSSAPISIGDMLPTPDALQTIKGYLYTPNEVHVTDEVPTAPPIDPTATNLETEKPSVTKTNPSSSPNKSISPSKSKLIQELFTFWRERDEELKKKGRFSSGGTMTADGQIDYIDEPSAELPNQEQPNEEPNNEVPGKDLPKDDSPGLEEGNLLAYEVLEEQLVRDLIVEPLDNTNNEFDLYLDIGEELGEGDIVRITELVPPISTNDVSTHLNESFDVPTPNIDRIVIFPKKETPQLTSITIETPEIPSPIVDTPEIPLIVDTPAPKSDKPRPLGVKINDSSQESLLGTRIITGFAFLMVIGIGAVITWSAMTGGGIALGIGTVSRLVGGGSDAGNTTSLISEVGVDAAIAESKITILSPMDIDFVG